MDCRGLDGSIAIGGLGVGTWIDDYGLGYIIFKVYDWLRVGVPIGSRVLFGLTLVSHGSLYNFDVYFFSFLFQISNRSFNSELNCPPLSKKSNQSPD